MIDCKIIILIYYYFILFYNLNYIITEKDELWVYGKGLLG